MPDNLNSRLRQKFELREAITVATEHDDDDSRQPHRSEAIGRSLARAAAGYVHEALVSEGARRPELRIGVAWGSIVSWVAERLRERSDDEREGLKRLWPSAVPRRISAHLFWYPLIGNIGIELAPTQAVEIAHRLAEIYAGKVRALGIGGIEPPRVPGERGPSPAETKYFGRLAERGDLVLTSASHWHTHHPLLTVGQCRPERLPPVGAGVAGLLGGVFLAPDGAEVPREETHSRIASFTWEGFRRMAERARTEDEVRKPRVVLVAGGQRRRPVILAALRGKLVSALVTTQESGKWLLAQPGLEVPA